MGSAIGSRKRGSWCGAHDRTSSPDAAHAATMQRAPSASTAAAGAHSGLPERDTWLVLGVVLFPGVEGGDVAALFLLLPPGLFDLAVDDAAGASGAERGLLARGSIAFWDEAFSVEEHAAAT